MSNVNTEKLLATISAILSQKNGQESDSKGGHMKSQEELYQALEKVDGIIRDNRLFETLQNASKMVNVISIMQAESKRSNDIAFKRAVEDVISMYSSLLDEAIDDLQAIAYAVNTHVDFGLSEPEAEEDTEGAQ